MFETNIVVIGNVLTAPEWRRTPNSTLVANFRVASTARRVDRETGRWTDGNQLRVRVNCWRKLAEGVASSIRLGDPVVVTGRLYTRDWTDAEGNLRTTYEMEAVAVGLDLSRGRARFFRNRPTLSTSAVDGPEADGQVRGEAAELLPADEVPVGFGAGLPDDESEPDFDEVPPHLVPGSDPVAALAGLTPAGEPAELEMEVAAIPAGEPVEADTPDGAGDSPADGPRRSRRAGRRQPVSV